MRAGTETALARVVAVFGAAQPHCAYLFANRRANRMKVLVHDGFGIWPAARRLNQGKFHWPGIRQGPELELNTEQLQALVLDLPWQRMGSGGARSSTSYGSTPGSQASGQCVVICSGNERAMNCVSIRTRPCESVRSPRITGSLLQRARASATLMCSN